MNSSRLKYMACLALALLLRSPFSTAADAPFVSQQEHDYSRTKLTSAQLNPSALNVPAAELKARAGLPNFFARVNSGKPVTIAYFGGSITAHEGWRPQSFSGLQQAIPASQMKMVNACVGGSGSIVGLFRSDKDLIAANPDLVFIEFAVNDGSDALKRPRDVARALEGVIRKLRTARPDTDICFVYTMQEMHVGMLKRGICNPTMALHEQIADYFSLPSINVGPGVIKLIDSAEAVFLGKVADKSTGKDAQGKLVISEDKTHPVLPTGHAVYSGIVLRAMAELAKSAPAAATMPLPKPLYGETWEKAKTIPAEGNASFEGNWEKLTAADGPSCMRFGTKFYDWFPHLFRTYEPGAKVTVKFNGTMVGIKGVLQGPDVGIVDIHVDGKLVEKKNYFSVYSNRFAYIGEPLSEMKSGEHVATWTLLPEAPDKGKILSSYYRPENFEDFKANPANYKRNGFSVGEIILIGDVIPAR